MIAVTMVMTVMIQLIFDSADNTASTNGNNSNKNRGNSHSNNSHDDKPWNMEWGSLKRTARTKGNSLQLPCYEKAISKWLRS